MTAIFSYIPIVCIVSVQTSGAWFLWVRGVRSTRISVDAHVPICYNETM